MIPLIKWTLWQRRRSIIGWSIGISLLIFINMIFYPTFKDQAAELQKSFESLPEAAVQLFGGSTDFFSPVGFLNSQIFFMMLPLYLAIMAIGLGHKLIAQEEQDKSIELILSRPISRSKLLLAKSTAGIMSLIIVTVVGLATTLIVGEIVKLDINTVYVLLATLSCFLLIVSFGAVAFMLSALGKPRSVSVALSATLALGGYIIVSLVSTVSWLEIPSKFFPFYYYKSSAILYGYMEWSNLLFFGAIIVLCGIISWVAFRRRDIG